MSDTQNKRIEEIEGQIEALESSLSTVRKVTPMHDATWYVKWVSVVLVCCAVLCRSVEEVPKIYDVFFSIFGTAGWLWVGFRWHDRALIVLNTILLAMLVSGGARYIVQWLM
jgi:hypothetical protein|tara:strand:+ start:207 stop:542 length:336 start_codon:yes stop_codon:yes gene_type:complete